MCVTGNTRQASVILISEHKMDIFFLSNVVTTPNPFVVSEEM